MLGGFFLSVEGRDGTINRPAPEAVAAGDANMIAYGVRRRVLLTAGPQEQQPFRILFANPILADWELILAESLDRAGAVITHTSCESLLVHEDLIDQEGANALVWLSKQREVPMILIGGQNAEASMRAFQGGVSLSMCRDVALAHPSLMSAVLQQAQRMAGERQRHQQTLHQLSDSRRHIDRLVGLIWRTAPAVDRDDHWFTQRHMMDRLQEEIARRDRHGIPFTLAIGEVDVEAEAAADTKLLPDWTSEVVGRAKRRCDVVGQYGLNGFMLLMVHTPKPGALTCCRRLQKLIEQPPVTEPKGPIRAYFGVAGSHVEGSSAKSLLRSAEENLELARTGLHDRIVADYPARNAG